MPANAIIGTGIMLRLGDGATPTEAFVDLAELTALKPPGESRNEMDVSTHNKGSEEKILGMLRMGQITGKCNLVANDPTQSVEGAGLRAKLHAGSQHNFQIALPDGPAGTVVDGTTMTYPGQVQSFEIDEVGVDSPLSFAFAITVTDVDAVTIVEAEAS